MVILAFIDNFFNKPSKPDKYYYVVAVFKTKNELIARCKRQELITKGFSDVDYIYILKDEKYSVFLGKSNKCENRCDKIINLKTRIISKTNFKDAYIWKIKQ